MERVKGIEPSFQAWEAHVLPLNHTRVCGDRRLTPAVGCEPVYCYQTGRRLATCLHTAGT